MLLPSGQPPAPISSFSRPQASGLVCLPVKQAPMFLPCTAAVLFSMASFTAMPVIKFWKPFAGFRCDWSATDANIAAKIKTGTLFYLKITVSGEVTK